MCRMWSRWLSSYYISNIFLILAYPFLRALLPPESLIKIDILGFERVSLPKPELRAH